VTGLDAWLEGEWRAWGVRPPAAELAAWRAVLGGGTTLASQDDGKLVAGLAMVPGTLTVPGSELPISIMASAWVEPAHRRRGLLRALMRQSLDALHTDGVAVVALVPAESGIYRSFGFGAACQVATVRVPARAAGFTSSAPIRLAEKEEALPHLAVVYERARTEYPGMLARDSAWWAFSYHSATEGPMFFALHADGFAAYRVEQKWTDGNPDDTVSIHELVANTPEAYAALWRHCLDLDLASRVVAYNRPLDEPLLHLLSDPRRLRQRPLDSLHVRLLDVEAALTARRYAGEVSVVVEVEDEFCAWNDGRYRVDGGGCRRTEEPADLSLDAAALASVYLGGSSVDSLSRAGRVRECRPGAVKQADVHFAWSPRPWLSWSY
jgi:predicted acetyltransferase